MVDDPLDIFDPKHIYPTGAGAKKKEEQKEQTEKVKSPYEMNRQELREYYKNKREEDRVKRYVSNLHASDEYVRRLEDQLVMAKAFITYNKLEPDLEKYKQKVQEVNNAIKKEKTKT